MNLFSIPNHPIQWSGSAACLPACLPCCSRVVRGALNWPDTFISAETIVGCCSCEATKVQIAAISRWWKQLAKICQRFISAPWFHTSLHLFPPGDDCCCCCCVYVMPWTRFLTSCWSHLEWKIKTYSVPHYQSSCLPLSPCRCFESEWKRGFSQGKLLLWRKKSGDLCCECLPGAIIMDWRWFVYYFSVISCQYSDRIRKRQTWHGTSETRYSSS